MLIEKLPLELLLMIIEKLRFTDAYGLCKALNISREMAYQYHKFLPEKDFYYSTFGIFDFINKRITNPNFAKAFLKNSRFQSLADANHKARFAVLTEDLEIFKAALNDPGIDHNVDDWNCDPLQFACEYGQLDFVKLLVNDYGEDISKYDNAPLIEASEAGHIDIVKYILSHPAFDPETFSAAISETWYFYHSEIVCLLLSDPRFDPSYNNNQAIFHAAGYGCVDSLQILLQNSRVDPSDQNNQAIIKAAKRGNTEILKLLLEDHRVDPSDQNNQAVINAAKKGNSEILKLLLEDHRVDPSDQNNQAVINAAKRGNTEILMLLLEDSRVNPADQNNKATWYVAKEGNVEMFKLLHAAVHRAQLEACDRGDLSQAFNLMKCFSEDDYIDQDDYQ